MPTVLGIDIHLWADGIAFAFAAAACILCVIQIHHHIYHNHHPDTRKYIIRILLMVIVYCIESWTGLYMPSLSLYLDAIRDTYEALVVYSFYQLLVHSLGGYENVQHALLFIPMHSFPHLFPFKFCCKAWSFTEGRIGSNSFLRNTTIGVLQYCFVQPLCAIATFIMHVCGVYHEGEFGLKSGYPYITFIRSMSQSYAIYCLVLFYLALKKQPIESEGYQLFNRIRPIPKFLCIKGVVFFTYWQSIVIALLVYFGVLEPTDTWTTNNIAIGLQDLMICVEMLFFAIAHVYAFRVDDFTQDGYTPLVPPHKVIYDVVNVADVMHDATEILIRDDDDDDIDSLPSINNEHNIQNESNEENQQKQTKKKKKKKKRKSKKRSRAQNKNVFNSTPTTLESEMTADSAL